jgi:hypothetical protein
MERNRLKKSVKHDDNSERVSNSCSDTTTSHNKAASSEEAANKKTPENLVNFLCVPEE